MLAQLARLLFRIAGWLGGTTTVPTTPLTRRRHSYLITEQEHTVNALWALVCWVLSLIAIVLVVLVVSKSSYWSLIIGVFIWILVMTNKRCLRVFMLAVPEATGAITINRLVHVTTADPYANQRVYPVGLWFKLPPEQVKDGLFINLRIVSQPYQEDFPAGDDVVLAMRGGFIYRSPLELLPRYVAVDDTVINGSLVDMTTSLLLQEIVQGPAHVGRGKVKEWQDALLAMLGDTTTAFPMLRAQERDLLLRQGLNANFEDLFGIDFISVLIADADYEMEYQKSLNQQARGLLLERRANEIKDRHPAMSELDAHNVALLEFGLVTKNIWELSGATPLFNTLGNSLGQWLSGITPPTQPPAP